MILLDLQMLVDNPSRALARQAVINKKLCRCIQTNEDCCEIIAKPRATDEAARAQLLTMSWLRQMQIAKQCVRQHKDTAVEQDTLLMAVTQAYTSNKACMHH